VLPGERNVQAMLAALAEGPVKAGNLPVYSAGEPTLSCNQVPTIGNHSPLLGPEQAVKDLVEEVFHLLYQAGRGGLVFYRERFG
jgi:hypothetical protein